MHKRLQTADCAAVLSLCSLCNLSLNHMVRDCFVSVLVLLLIAIAVLAEAMYFVQDKAFPVLQVHTKIR